MFRNQILFIATLGMSGCITSKWEGYVGELWSDDISSASDGVYVRLPYAQLLVRIKDDGSYNTVDLKGALPTRMVDMPDAAGVLVFAEWQSCKDDDDDIVLIEECDEDDLVTHSELAVVQDGVRTGVHEIPSHLNTIAFSSDGDVAVAYLDSNSDETIRIEGVADLGEVRFINLQDGNVGSASVGFSPSEVLFAPNNQAVVMSRSQVVVVDLDTFEKVLEAPLTLDADQNVDPSGAELAYDADSETVTLLLTVTGSSDLYMLDLETVYWNIGDLGAVPSDIGVDSLTSRSVFVFSGSSKAVILDHGELATLNSGSIEDINLEEPSNKTLMGDGFSLLYNDSHDYVHDVYRLDLTTSELTEYVVENPLNSLQLSTSGAYAVGIMRPEVSSGGGLSADQDSRYGIAVLDMASDDVVNLVAETRPLGVELIETEDGGSYALALLSGIDTLLKIDLSNPSGDDEIDLPAAATKIGSLPDGRFIISHDIALGMISYLDPETNTLTTVQDFAAIGLLMDDELPRRGGEEK